MFSNKQANLARMGAFWLVSALIYAVIVIALSSGVFAGILAK